MKILNKVMLTSVVVLGSGLLVANAHAAENNTASTSATVAFQEDSGKTDPVSPTDPSKPLDPADPDNPGTGNAGTLTLDVAPKAFTFGPTAASNNAMTIKAGNVASKQQYLQVSDKRTDINGWQVKVKQDAPFASSDGSKLSGVTVSIPKGQAYNSLATPATTPVTSGLNASAVTTTDNIDGSAASQNVFTADDADQTGKSVSTDVWDPTNVELNVPRYTAKVGNFSTTLTWSLVAGA